MRTPLRMTEFSLRPYRASDEETAIALWHRTWRQAYPDIDFTARRAAWRERWKNELAPTAHIVIAEQNNAIVGFVTVDTTGYLDQLVVDPDLWGSRLGDTLIGEAKKMSPGGITLLVNTDNAPFASISAMASSTPMTTSIRFQGAPCTA